MSFHRNGFSHDHIFLLIMRSYGSNCRICNSSNRGDRTKLVVYRGSGRWGRLLHAVRGDKYAAVITVVRRDIGDHLVELVRIHARVNGSVGLLRVEMYGTVS